MDKDQTYEVTITFYSTIPNEDGMSAQTFVLKTGEDLYFKQPANMRALSLVVDRVEAIRG